MRHYTQLTEAKRYQISALMKTGTAVADIAKVLAVHKSTIYRELQRNRGKRGFASHDRRGQIVERQDIDERPAIIEQRQCLGDYEGDTIIGKGHRGAAVTLVDRVTREVKIKIIPKRTAELVAKSCIELLQGELVNSITFDNGKEFANHQNIAKALNTDIFSPSLTTRGNEARTKTPTA